MSAAPLPPDVDWSKLPTPVDDGAADHLVGHRVPRVSLMSTGGEAVDLGTLPGLSVVFVYPRTAQPGVALPEGWDMIPGARGCTNEACSFRDLAADLAAAGADRVFGLSTQAPEWQSEAVERLHLPFQLLSDAQLAFANALRLPRFEAGGETLLKRLTLIVQDGVVARVNYPVFPPDQSAALALDQLQRMERAK